MTAPEQPKLIVDSDWKSQAQAEKQRLAEKEAAQAAQAKEREPAFEDIVSFLTQNAMMYMGYFPDPETGQAMVALDYAKIYIDLMGILETKTKGNLTPTEAEFLTKTAADLRAGFVQLQSAVAKAVAEGRIKPRAPGAPMGAGPMPGPKGPSAGPGGGTIITPP